MQNCLTFRGLHGTFVVRCRHYCVPVPIQFSLCIFRCEIESTRRDHFVRWIKLMLSFLAATKQLYERYFPSVCPSVCLSHLFDYVPIIVSSWNFQELSHWTRVRSMQKVKVRGQRSQRSRPKFSFPDCNSSLNSHMMMKWYIKLDVA